MMKPISRRQTLGIVIVLIASMMAVAGGALKPTDSVNASAVGPLRITGSSCGHVAVEFYYDGLDARHLYNLSIEGDQFHLNVQNKSCVGAGCPPGNPDYFLGEEWKSVPGQFGNVQMSARWQPHAGRNGIEVTVEQVNLNTDPPVVVGHTLHHYYECEDPKLQPATVTQPVVINAPAPAPQPVAQPVTSVVTGAFSFQCTGSGIQVLAAGTPVINTTFAQIVQPLTVAIMTGQNQPIAYGPGVSLWALKSNELQAHVDSNPDATKQVVPADACGPIVIQPSTVFQPAAVSQPVLVPSTVQTVARGTVYIVRPGDNLFRIALRHGLTVQTLAAANGITNPNLIYAGQRIIIP